MNQTLNSILSSRFFLPFRDEVSDTQHGVIRTPYLEHSKRSLAWRKLYRWDPANHFDAFSVSVIQGICPR
jgi:hypothetical protein